MLRQSLLLSSIFLLTHAQLERMSAASEESGGITDNDKIACRELKEEYRRVCQDPDNRRKEEEFCRAFDNVCLRLTSSPSSTRSSHNQPRQLLVASQDEEEQEQSFSSTRPPFSSSTRRPDFTEFCRRFKNRYLFVCPNPFRFGQKAVVFCPIYSERCDVPLPDKPVVPQRKVSGRNFAVDRLCASYANFANQYCRNPLFLAQAQYRASCEKYWRFCSPRQ